jgi:phage terminase large subunit
VLNESEIWMTFNPDLETDYTYSRFVADPPVNAFVVKMTWRDNPWFPRVLLSEMEDLQKRDYDAYLNVWEGNPRRMLEGVVFKEQLRAVEAENRICDVPWDRETPVDTFWDLGRRDMTSIWFGQRVAMQYRMLAYLENAGPDIHWYLKELQKYPYTYGTFYLPHDASAKRLGEKRTIEQIVRGMGHTVRIVPRASKKVNAINAARVVFPSVWFDSKGTKLGLKRLRHYAYRITDGQRSEEPLHDENSNGADAFMTMAQAIQGPRAPSTLLEKLTRAAYREYEQGSQGLGWLA